MKTINNIVRINIGILTYKYIMIFINIHLIYINMLWFIYKLIYKHSEKIIIYIYIYIYIHILFLSKQYAVTLFWNLKNKFVSNWFI